MAPRKQKKVRSAAKIHVPHLTKLSKLVRDACIGKQVALIAPRVEAAMQDPASHEQVELNFGHWAVTSLDQDVINEASRCGATIRVETVEWMLFNLQPTEPLNLCCASQQVIEQAIGRAMKRNWASHVYRIVAHAPCQLSQSVLNETLKWATASKWTNAQKLVDALISAGAELAVDKYAAIKKAMYGAPEEAVVTIIRNIDTDELDEMRERDLVTWACSRRTDHVAARFIMELAARGVLIYPRSSVLRNVISRGAVQTLRALFDTAIQIDRYPKAVQELLNEAKDYI